MKLRLSLDQLGGDQAPARLKAYNIKTGENVFVDAVECN